MSEGIQRLTASHPPVFLVNSRLGLVTATPSGSGREGLHLIRAVLLPKLRTQVAEFLSMVSLTRLRILSSPTCVGLRYGWQEDSLRGFSWQPSIGRFAGETPSSSGLGVWVADRICLACPPTPLNLDVHHPADLAFCVPSVAQTPSYQYGNINPFAIGYACRPGLRCRLTLS